MNNSLKTVLRLNSLSCLGSGLAFIIAPELIAEFLGGISPFIIKLVGAGLAINGIHLLIVSFRNKINRLELGYFILGDFLWVLASLTLITLFPQVIYSPSAITCTLVVAIMVGSFAILQTKFGWGILSCND